MYTIQNLTTDSLQTQSVILPDGGQVSFTLKFVPLQYGWFLSNLNYLDFTLSNLRVCNSPNMLNQFKNRLPFGLACFSKANREPSLLQDFASGASVLYVLSAAEVAEYTEYLSE